MPKCGDMLFVIYSHVRDIMLMYIIRLYIICVHRNPQNDLQAQARAHRIGQVHTYIKYTIYILVYTCNLIHLECVRILRRISSSLPDLTRT